MLKFWSDKFMHEDNQAHCYISESSFVMPLTGQHAHSLADT